MNDTESLLTPQERALLRPLQENVAALLQTADAITTKYNNASTELVALQRENEALKSSWHDASTERDMAEAHCEDVMKENEALRKALEVIAQDIGSTHAATKAREALKALTDTTDARAGMIAASELDPLVGWLKEIEQRCPCGARPDSPNTHPHVISCPVELALIHIKALRNEHTS